MVYTAESASLAMLEILVHVERAALLPSYVLFEVEIPEELVMTLDEAHLPEGWANPIIAPTTRAIGDKWVQEADSVALRVPSSIVPGVNYLINPQHSDFAKLRIGKPLDLPVDERLRR